jgi:serine/threonine-protein kinase LegK1
VLKALKEQVSDRGIIHRDLKPQNIMVTLHPTISANIIDFGLSKLVHDTVTPTGGTPNFAAPEMYEDRAQTQKTDVFCIARVLGLLWRDLPGNYSLSNEMAYMYSLNINYNNLFTGLAGISEINRNIIRTMLTNMSHAKTNNRPSIEKAIEAFESIQPKQQKIPTPKPQISKATIEEQIANIFLITNELRLKNLDLRDRGFKDLGKKYSGLAEQIELKTKQFQARKPEERKTFINTYLKECQELIDPVKDEMKNNRDANYILANLGLAIAGLGLFYLIAITCNKISTGNWLFFSRPKSLELAENLESGLQQVAAAAA